ncbi:Uncharacterised protein [Vibrio cholerae]|nr:Uncharacterised protein [Vibrio cholerae]
MMRIGHSKAMQAFIGNHDEFKGNDQDRRGKHRNRLQHPQQCSKKENGQ